jgi:hypothetical protein
MIFFFDPEWDCIEVIKLVFEDLNSVVLPKVKEVLLYFLLKAQ